MTSYENHMELGLYRVKTGIVIGDGALGADEFEVDQPVAWNCYTQFRNVANPSDTYTLGFEYVKITAGAHSGDYIASHISSIAADRITVTLDAGTWDGETCEVGYYALGTGITAATQSIQDGDKWRGGHLDGIYRAMDLKGSVNPTEFGYVYDQAMAYREMPAITGSAVTAVEKEGSVTTGTWSFDNSRPYYVSNIRVEVKTTAISDTTEGIIIRVYEEGTEMVEEAGTTGIVMHHQEHWVNEHNDGVGTWLHGDIILGMFLCDHLKVTIEKRGTQPDISAGDIHVFVSGWHIGDPEVEFEGLNIPTNVTTYPKICGCYREDVLTATAASKVALASELAYWMDESLRTHPHHLGDYRYGVEFVKNLTTNEWVTGYISEITEDDLYFDASMVFEDDQLWVGYYSNSGTLGATGEAINAGDRVERGAVDGIIMMANRLDRTDFGKSTFPWSSGDYRYFSMFQNVYNDAAKWADLGTIQSNWVTIFHYDHKQLNSVEMTYPTTATDLAPFFVSGIVVLADIVNLDDEDNEWATINSERRDEYIELKVWLNGSELRQGGATTLRYYPLARCSHFWEKGPAALKTERDRIHGDPSGEGHAYYIPLGMARAYSLRVDARVVGADAFTQLKYRAVFVDGWS